MGLDPEWRKYDCADLDDTTRSQVYKDDRNSRASGLVDTTRGVGIIRNGQIVTTEYLSLIHI